VTGITSAALLQPADLLKTRVQQTGSPSLIATFREISSSPDAIRQLWRGALPSVIRTGFGSALYFTTLNALRQHVAASRLSPSAKVIPGTAMPPRPSSSSLPQLSNLANLTTGAIARATAGFVLMPITVIKVRYESSLYSYGSILGAASAIYRAEGIKGFFSGFGATAIRDAPYAGLYVVFYEQLKRRITDLSPGRGASAPAEGGMSMARSAPINFVSGILAAGLATALTNPFDAVKTRLQLMPRRYGNMARAARLMLQEEGVRSLFSGLGLRIGRKAMSSALAWTLYEELVRRAEKKWLASV
jgi:solute carrier family 25, member 38